MKENRPKNTQNRPKDTEKAPRQPIKLPAFFQSFTNEKTKRVIGVLLILTGVFLLVSFVWHLFLTGAADQSAIEPNATAMANQEVLNEGGWVGAKVAYFFITNGFGFITLLLPFYLILIGYSFLEPKYKALAIRVFPYFLGTVLWFSTAMSFLNLVADLQMPDLGGGVGESINDWFSVLIGRLGMGLLLIFTLIAFAIYKFNMNPDFLKTLPLPETFSFLWKKDAAAAQPAEAQAAENQTKNTAKNEVKENVETEKKTKTEEPEELPLVVEVRKVERTVQPEPAPAEPVVAVVNPFDAFKQQLEGEEVAVAPAKRKNGQPEFFINNEPITTAFQQPELPLKKTEPEFIVEPPKSEPEVQFSKLADLLNKKDDDEEAEIVDNIVQVEEEKFIKDIPQEDLEALDPDEDVGEWEAYDPTKDLSRYQYPTIELLNLYENPNGIEVNRQELENNKNNIVRTLKNYGIEITSIKATIGPTVTLYEIVPAPGVRISKIKNLEDDIALSLAALGIRIIAPMPGKGTIGIEIPNSKPEIVSLRSVIATEKFRDSKAALPIAIGKTISNEVFIADLAKMPHLLVAGATGQGKSVGLNCIIASLLYKKHPAQVKFVLIDPKKVEMTLYQLLEKHFLAKLPNYEDAIITDNKQVIHVLNSLCLEMDNRYALLQQARVRNLTEYNDKFINRRLNPRKGHKYLPYIVLIIDELADLMMTAGKEIETPIARLAQLARAVGIHLVVATQRPSVNVITGTIKANFPVRLSYRVISKTDSRTILDSNGAEQLIGRGDVLLFTGSELIRIQNALMETEEVDRLVNYISMQPGYSEPFYLPEFIDENAPEKGSLSASDLDSKFEEAARLIVVHQLGSTSLIQRRLNLGYNRAGRIMDQMETMGIVGPNQGSKPRDVLYKDEAELERFLSTL